MRRRTARGRRATAPRSGPARMAARRAERLRRRPPPASEVSGQRPGQASRRTDASSPLRTHVLVVAPILLVLVIILVGGYVEHWAWTGYRDQQKLRTLWDWLEVSVLPLAVALTPVWLRTRIGHGREWRVAVYVAATVFALLALAGYRLGWEWTGFTGNTLWDWLKLFLVPFVLPLGLLFLTAESHPTRTGEIPRASTPAATGKGRAGRDKRAPTVALVAGAAALVGIGMVAAFRGGFGHAGAAGSRPTDAAAGTPTPSAAALGATPRLTVDGRDSRWTDTGISITPDEQIAVSSSGNVQPGRRPGYPWVSPAGLTPALTPPGHLSIDDTINHAALIATVAPPGRTRWLSQPTSLPVIDVGTHRTIAIPRAGELYLGINDRKTEDNQGSFTVTITLQTAP